MDERTKEKKAQLVGGLKQYFNGDIKKVKRFANQLKVLGFDFDDYNTLCAIELRSEAFIVLLGLSNFGVLTTVAKSIMHIRGSGNPDEYVKQYVDKFKQIPAPK